jgi:hypothetical protein
MSRTSSIFVASILLAACGAPARPAASSSASSDSPGAAAPASSLPAAITPTFAWKAGTRLRVDERTTSPDESVVALSYDMQVDEARDGLRIAIANVKVDPGHSKGSTSPDGMIEKILPAMRSDYVVTPAGALARVDYDAERTKRVIGASGLPAEMLEGLLSHSMLESLEVEAKAVTTHDWEDLVAMWTNRSLAPGGALDVDLTRPAPMLEQAHYDAKLSFAGYVACAPPRPERCAKLVSEGPLRPDANSKKLKVEARRRFELVADPATLLPYSSVLVVDASIGMIPNEPPMRVQQRVERTYTHR